MDLVKNFIDLMLPTKCEQRNDRWHASAAAVDLQRERRDGKRKVGIRSRMARFFRLALFGALLTPFVGAALVHAQSSACVAGETLTTFSFPAGSWTAGNLTGTYTAGAGAAT